MQPPGPTRHALPLVRLDPPRRRPSPTPRPPAEAKARGVIVLDVLSQETLRALRDAQGPLTVNAIATRIYERHGGVVPSAALYARLRRLETLGLVETYAETIGGVRSRIYWPTTLGREEPQ
jgi:Transcriptional regulator PadR-like family